jgi:hypothetical protein
MRDIRLGDDIDDFCVRCKRVMNHAVVSVMNGAPAKVRCRTCHSDHDFRNEQPPPPKVDPRKQGLFNEVLKKVDPDAAAVELDEPADSADTLEAEADADTEATAEAAGADIDVEAPKPKARGKKKA